MLITITRHYYTRDICQGELTVEGMNDMRLLTLEPALPRNLDNYIGHALPPDTYQCTCDVAPILFKGVPLRVPWITLVPVKWYPRMAVACSDFAGMPQRAQIFLGAVRTDNGFALDNPDNEAMKVWARLSKQVYDSGEEVCLRIVNADDLRYEDTYYNKAKIEAQEREEERKREGLMRELLGE